MTKHNREALDYFKHAHAVGPDDAEIHDLLGQTYMELGKYRAAERHLRRSIELGPKSSYGYYDLGNLLLRIPEKRAEARELLERAIELAPGDAWAHYCLGCWYALEGRKPEALDCLEKAFEKGFANREWMEKDRDLERLRDEPRYRKLVGAEIGGPGTEAVKDLGRAQSPSS